MLDNHGAEWGSCSVGLDGGVLPVGDRLNGSDVARALFGAICRCASTWLCGPQCCFAGLSLQVAGTPLNQEKLLSDRLMDRLMDCFAVFMQALPVCGQWVQQNPVLVRTTGGIVCVIGSAVTVGVAREQGVQVLRCALKTLGLTASRRVKLCCPLTHSSSA